MRVKSRAKLGATAVVLLAILLVFASCPAAAVEHDSGETWVYEVSTKIDVGAFVVDVEGDITYEFKDESSITLGTNEFDVNALSVDGDLSGTMDLFGSEFLEVNATIDGFLFEAVDGCGTVEENVSWLVDATIGTDTGTWSVQSVVQTVLTYAPPYMSEFDPSSIELGASWSEYVIVESVITTWENGTVKGVSTDRSNMVYSIVVDSAKETVATPAGEFDAIGITVTDQDGNCETRWWSEEVNGWVKIQYYSVADDDPVETMVLSSHIRGNSGSMLLVVVVGVAFTLFACAVLAIVVLQIRRSKV